MNRNITSPLLAVLLLAVLSTTGCTLAGQPYVVQLAPDRELIYMAPPVRGVGRNIWMSGDGKPSEEVVTIAGAENTIIISIQLDDGTSLFHTPVGFRAGYGTIHDKGIPSYNPVQIPAGKYTIGARYYRERGVGVATRSESILSITEDLEKGRYYELKGTLLADKTWQLSFSEKPHPEK